MNWFSNVMDCLKDSLELSARNKKIFIPSMVFLFIIWAFIIIFCIIAFVLAIGGIDAMLLNADYSTILFKVLPFVTAALFVFGIILPIVYCMVEAGLLGMLKSVVERGSTDSGDFFGSMGRNWFRIFIGVGIVSSILMLAFILAAVIILPAAAVLFAGIVTYGWAFIFAGVLINVYFGVWAAISIVDDIGPWKAVKKGFELSKKYFRPLFIMFLLPAVLSSYFTSLVFSIPLLGLIISPVLATIISTYFKLVIVKFYISSKNTDAGVSDCIRIRNSNSRYTV